MNVRLGEASYHPILPIFVRHSVTEEMKRSGKLKVDEADAPVQWQLTLSVTSHQSQCKYWEKGFGMTFPFVFLSMDEARSDRANTLLEIRAELTDQQGSILLAKTYSHRHSSSYPQNRTFSKNDVIVDMMEGMTEGVSTCTKAIVAELVQDLNALASQQ
jgi:hypothetical protein